MYVAPSEAFRQGLAYVTTQTEGQMTGWILVDNEVERAWKETLLHVAYSRIL